METLKLNETPLRTSRNFRINNITLENIEIPKNIKAFKNIEITSTSQVAENVSTNSLVFGTSKMLEKQVFENANHKLKIVANNKDEQINIKYLFDDENIELVNNIEIEANQDTNVIIQYRTITDKKCFHNGIIRTIAKENVNINIVIINLLNENSNHFEAIENEIQKNANVNYIIIDIGGQNSISNYYSNIIGENANNNLKTIYLGAKNQIKDLNYIAELKGEKTNIDIDVQGALKDNSKKHFKGTIDFKKGCKKAKGNENEFCMLLSDKAKSIALPMLLCTESDVEGNHSTASGKINNDDLFYIMSRGISYKDAIKLIVRARFHSILEGISNENIKQQIIEEIDKKLDE